MIETTVAFLWHMHQPLYRLRGERVCLLPWVRLHAVRSYYDMVRVLEEFPQIQVTVNLVPTLIEQIRAYERGATDAFWETASIPAEDLDEPQRVFLFDHFFSAQEDPMIRALPRYADLLERRQRARRLRGPDDAWKEFSTSDYRDLQALFDLAWFGFKAREDFPEIGALCDKRQGYTQENVREIQAVQKAILRRILPLYREAAVRGQVEISTSPYAHPILPLLIDSESAREALPGVTLPPRFQAPHDATRQIADALDYVEAEIGARPRGMWPAEGSISQEAMDLMAAAGVGWGASDADVLAASQLDGPADPHRAWTTSGPGGAVTLVFRDHELSDRIGFSYARLDPAVAAADFMGVVRQRADHAETARPLVVIALDGENPWEHYPQAGATFLRALYAALSTSPSVACRSVAGAVARCPPPGRILRLRAGSWIHADFGVWIGGPEKNRAWTVLGRVREELAAALQDPDQPEPSRIDGWASLRAAEGSDWFWWLDGQFTNLYREQFDALFRGHLRQAYEALGRPAPDLLDWPIPAPETRAPARPQAAPEVLLTPVIDGYEGDFFEWGGAVSINWDELDPQTSMQRARRPFEALRFAFSPAGELVLRLDPGTASACDRLAVMAIDLAFRSGERLRQVSLVLDEQGDLRQASWCAGGDPGAAGGPLAEKARRSAARAVARKILEVAVPMAEAGLEPEEEGFLVVRLGTPSGTLVLREISLVAPEAAAFASARKAS